MNITIAYPAFLSIFEHMFKQQITDFRIEDDIKNADLIIFSGGEDINPILYGELNRYSDCNPKRDFIEIQAFNLAMEYDKKILGVCRGHQLINALLGGKLVQDLRKNLNVFHRGHHPLTFLTDSILKQFFSEVNSMHHQGVIKPGEGLIPTSKHNKVFESCENENIITVQFHPEFMNSFGFFDFIKEWARR